jgi:hypothetical protein
MKKFDHSKSKSCFELANKALPFDQLSAIQSYFKKIGNPLKWERLFVSLYLKILDKIGNQSCEGSLLLKSFDLLIAMVAYVNGMEIEQLDLLVAELDREHLTDEEKNKLSDKKELKKFLVNPKVVAKYLSLLLYKADFIFRLMSLVDAPLLDPWQDGDESLILLTEEAFYGKDDFLDNLPFRNRVILLPTFLAILKNFSNGINFSGIDLTEATHQQVGYYVKSFVRGEYLFDEDINLADKGADPADKNIDPAIRNKIEFLLEHQHTLRDLVIVCLGNDRDKISEKVEAILAIQALHSNENEQSLAFVFYASLKALILLGNKDNLEILFSAFTERSISPEILIGYKLYDSIIQESERLEENSEEDSDEEDSWNENDLYKLASNNINLVGLLQQVELSREKQIEMLDWIWHYLFLPLSEEKRFDLLERGLSNSRALERNNIALLDWYKKKFQELENVCTEQYVNKGLDYIDVFIEKIHLSWISKRDYGAGSYEATFYYEQSKFSFNLSEENTTVNLLHWLKNSFENKKSFELQELLFDLSIKIKEKDIFDSTFDGFVLFPDTKKLKESYAVSRLMAVAVIESDSKTREILDLFWDKLINIENKKLQNVLKKRVLVDSTWAFQQAIKEGNINLMDWILSRIATLPKEETLSHLVYKCNLLYGIDLVSFITTKEPIVSAVISGKIEVLNKVYVIMASLIDELDLDPVNELYLKTITSIGEISDLESEPESDLESEEEFNQNEDLSSRRANIFSQLKQDYIKKGSFTCLGYIPIFYNNKDYIHQINESNLFTREEKEEFITNAFKSAIKYNNAEMLAVVWEQIEKNRPFVGDQALFLMTIKPESPKFYFSKLFGSLLKSSDSIGYTKVLFEKFENLAINFSMPDLIPILQARILAAKTLKEEHEKKHKGIWQWLNQHPASNELALASSSYVDAPTEPDAKKQCTKKVAYSFLERADELRCSGEAFYSKESCRDHPAKAVERGLKDDLPAGLQESIQLEEEETIIRKRIAYGS